jgi:hypothetical protein
VDRDEGKLASRKLGQLQCIPDDADMAAHSVNKVHSANAIG